MVDKVAAKMAEASATVKPTPKKGERFRCQKCGMELQVTAGCQCTTAEHVRLECCGQAMAKQ